MKPEKSSSSERIRIGLVGAGGNTRARHIPGFRALENVEIVSVANRTRESAERVAKEFDIPKVYDNWLDLVSADDTDAVCIGTWPHMHCTVTLTAVDCHKHVLCEARMAMNAHEAHTMLGAFRQRPDLVAQVVPSPFTLPVDRAIIDILECGEIGDVLAVDMQLAGSGFLDRESPITWRQDVRFSGTNVMTLGIWYESLIRWLGPADRVMAMGQATVSTRRDGEGRSRAVRVPDHLDVVAHLARGPQVNMRFSAVSGLAPNPSVRFYGSEGTLELDAASLTLRMGKRGDSELAAVEIADAKKGAWRVEEEFINAVRGVEPVRLTTFEDGVAYMEFTDAVQQSMQSGQMITL